MFRKILLAVFLLWVTCAQGQYKNDNVLYKTVDWTNLCNELQNNKGYLLLDVRSAPEFNDTSTYINIGHIKGAENINVRELGNRLSEIDAYKNKPVFVYCSHSQRSRRASKMLADSGFTKIFNINAGITALYYANAKDQECLQQLIVTKNKYNVISSAELCKKLSDKANNIFILDVRNDSAFRHISRDAKENALGIIKTSVNIPIADLEKNINSIPNDKEIIITDLDGGEAAKAAVWLKGKGFEKVSFLLEGIERLLSEDNSDADLLNKFYTAPVIYKLMTPVVFGKKIAGDKNILVLDVRTTDEFTNKHTEVWRNIGRIKNAMNIPVNELPLRISEINKYKNSPIFLYDFGGDNEVFNAANILTQQGFTKVNVLMGGLFNIRWTAANRNQPFLKDLVEDVPSDNL